MENNGTGHQKLVLVVGAGPAGLFSANKLAEAGHKVVILNRDIKYGGLAEYGIYVTKHKMKEGLRKQFRKIIGNPNIEYLGNVTVGKSGKISLDELKQVDFDAIVISAGAQGTKNVGIPGEDAKGVYHAKDVVYHYNYLPPYSEMEFPVGDRVAIIGVGNVMVDIAHWLTHIKNAKEVIAVARRGPNERAYTDKEMKAIAYNMDKDAVKSELERIRPALESVEQNVENTYNELTKDCNEPYYEKQSPTKFYFKFLYSPKRIITNENNEVVGLEVENNTLQLRDGKIAAKALGTTEILDVSNVVFAIGDRVDTNLGIPVNKWGEFVKNEKPYQHDPDAHLYEVFDDEKGDVMKGMFVIGWSRKASDGLVGIAKKDGETGAKYVLKYLEGPTSESSRNTEEKISHLFSLFKEKGITAVNKKDIEFLEFAEKAEAEKRGIEFFKYNFNSDMLNIIEQERKEISI